MGDKYFINATFEQFVDFNSDLVPIPRLQILRVLTKDLNYLNRCVSLLANLDYFFE